MSETENNIYDVLIIGGGIAGFSAALYTSRQGLKTLVITIDIGGQLSYADIIENYPGVESISGLSLALKIQNQALSFGTNVIIDEVVSLRKENNLFILETKNGESYKAIAVIAACGKAPRKLYAHNEEKFIGKGLSYCIVCDAPLYRDRDVALVSFGERGIESLESLASIANRVYYIVSNDKDKSIAIAKEIPNVVVYPGYTIKEINGDKHVEEIVIENKNRDTINLKVSGIFVELGFEIRANFLKNLVEFNNKGEVVVDSSGQTKTEGLFAAGDLVNIPYKQAIISAASGVIAALSAINYVYKYKGSSRMMLRDWEKKQKIVKKSLRL